MSLVLYSGTRGLKFLTRPLSPCICVWYEVGVQRDCKNCENCWENSLKGVNCSRGHFLPATLQVIYITISTFTSVCACVVALYTLYHFIVFIVPFASLDFYYIYITVSQNGKSDSEIVLRVIVLRYDISAYHWSSWVPMIHKNI